MGKRSYTRWGVLALALAVSLGLVHPWRTGNDAAIVLELARQQALAALGAGAQCGPGDRCDRLTGCIAPARPLEPLSEALPDDDRHAIHVRNLRIFQLCRKLVQHSLMRPAAVTLATASGRDPEAREMAERISIWNREHLWASASASEGIITRFGDEARAVFGPIPDGDCSDGAARSIPLEVEGNVVDVKPNPAKAGSPLEFEHRDAQGNFVKWARYLSQCDKPSLAGNVTYCGMNSRLSRVVRGNVEWLTFCRKSTQFLAITADPYWQKSNPKFARLGMIGFNNKTGEIVFFDGGKGRGEFDWSKPFIPPGGRSYADRIGRATAEKLYDPTFQVECSACHDNKGPYSVTPHIGLSRVGNRNRATGVDAHAQGLGKYLPWTERKADTPFRIVGSAYSSTYAYQISSARTVRDPAGNCTSCHTLTTQITGQRLAADAVAMEPDIIEPTRSQRLRSQAEAEKLGQIAIRRTDWALRSGAGKIHPWMLPVDGNDLDAQGLEISPADWQRLSNCLWEAGGEECGYRPLYTACPAPGAGSDGSEPSAVAITTLPAVPGQAQSERRLHLSWKYLNSYGGVPQRDDVRFDVAIKAVPVPASGQPPVEADYPSLDEAKGRDFAAVDGEVGISGSAILVRNVSYSGHAKFTDPAPAVVPRAFSLDMPARCNRRYLVRILPKRLCFDQSGVAFGAKGDLHYADVSCSWR